MASIPEALLTSAQGRIKESVKDAKEHVVNQFDPRKAIYQLGLGIGPMIRQTVAEYGKQQKRESATSEKAVVKSNDKNSKKVVKSIDDSGKKLNANLTKLSSNLDGMNRILIKMHHQQMLQSGELELIRERAKGGKGLSGNADTPEPKAFGEKVSSFMDSDIGSLVKLIGGGLVAGEIWKNLDSKTKEQIGDAVQVIGKEVLSGTLDLWGKAFKSAPVATLLGTFLAAKMSGVIGLATGGWKAAKGLYQVGKGAQNVVRTGKWSGAAPSATQATPSAPIKPPVPVEAPTSSQPEGWKQRTAKILGVEEMLPSKQPTSTKPPIPGGVPPTPKEEKRATGNRDARRAQENQKFEEFKKQGMSDTEARTAAKEFNKQAAEAAAERAAGNRPAPGATQTPEGTSGGSAWGKAGRTAMKVGGRALGALGVYGSYKSYEYNKEKGNNWLAGLDAVSGITGAAALGLGVTGVGLPAAAVLGGISLATGAASAVGSLFVDDEPKAKPTETPTGQKNNNSHAQGDLSKLRWSDLSTEQQEALLNEQQKREGYNATDNGGRGTRSYRNNNPGNIKAGDFTRRHGAIGSDGTFAIFKTYAEGRAAQRALWEGSGYRDLPLDKALQRWHAATGADRANYNAGIAKAISNPSSTVTAGATNPNAASNATSGSDSALDLRSATSGGFTADQLKDLKDKDGILKAFGDITSMLPEMLAGTYANAGNKAPADKPAAPAQAPARTPTPSTVSQSSEKMTQLITLARQGGASSPRYLYTGS